MKRPDNPILVQLENAISQVHRAEKALADAKASVSDHARSISTVESKQERRDLSTYAYWHLPEVPVSDLAFGATGKEHPAHLHKLMGPVAVGIQCDGCGKEVPITSRTQMKDAQERLRRDVSRWAEGYRVVCPDCEHKIFEDRRSENEARDAANATRYTQLKAMSYSDYVLTPDWAKELREQVDFARWENKSNVLPCEACAHENAVGLYHKSLGRRGHEWSNETIFLGEGCASVFENNGLIAGKPSSGNLLKNHTLPEQYF